MQPGRHKFKTLPQEANRNSGKRVSNLLFQLASFFCGFDRQLPVWPKPTKVKHKEYRHLAEAIVLVLDVHSTDEENGRDCKVSA